MSEPRLLTLSEAADQTGLTVDALRKRIQRGRLRSFRGNDGLVRVRLSEAEMEELRADRPSSRPASPLEEQSPVVKALEAHNETLREQLAKAEQRAGRAEERAEKAEQRLIEELARLAGQNNGIPLQIDAPASAPNELENSDLEEVLAELRLEFEGKGRALSTHESSEPMQIEGRSPDEEANSKPETAALVIPLVPESRRIWWSRFVPRRRRLT